MRYAVVIANLGGPSSLKEVKPFLMSLFNDRYMLPYPKMVRRCLAQLITAARCKKSQSMYRAIGGKSPITEATDAQAQKLKHRLKNMDSEDEFNVFVYMRYSGRSARDIFKDIISYKPDKIILLPLYPHMTSSTTLSMFDVWNKVMATDNIKHVRICCFYNDQLFLRAQSKLIREAYDSAASGHKVRIIFSAHSIPQSFIDKGDVYETQVVTSARHVVDMLSIPELDWRVSYQSKMGPIKWLEPSTHSEIISAGHEGLFIIIVPLSFVCDNVEVLYEMDILYKKAALTNGATGYHRVSTLGTNKLFIESLTRQVMHARNKEGVISCCNIMPCKKICPIHSL